MATSDNVLIAAAGLLFVLAMLVWALWYVLGFAAERLGRRYPRLGRLARTVTFSLSLIGLVAWFAGTYRDALRQIVSSLGQ